MSQVLYSVEKQKRLLVPLHSLRLQLPIMMSTESRRRHALCALHFHSDLKKGKIVQYLVHRQHFENTDNYVTSKQANFLKIFKDFSTCHKCC